MQFKYCPLCGQSLVEKEIGDEGKTPFCLACERPFFLFPYPSILAVVINKQKEVVLLKQNYLSKKNWGVVAGFLQIGESVEQTVAREIEEEIGLKITSCQYIASYPHHDLHDQDVILLGYVAFTEERELKLSKEVNFARWFTLDEADDYFRPDGVARKLYHQVRNFLGY